MLDLAAFYDALERRHLSELTFQEVRRALAALSTLYVERRDKLPDGKVFDGAGKRAAFALFYGPMHLSIVYGVVQQLGACSEPLERIIDLGCGTGVCGAAWALAAGGRPTLIASDMNSWAVSEARFTFEALGVRGEARVQDLERARFDDAGPGTALLLGYVVNELSDEARQRLLERLAKAKERGARILIVEPIAKRDRPWWNNWVQALGARTDEWRLPNDLPQRWRLLDKAAGLRHQHLSARTLYAP